jgi:hypothetical protein
MRSLMGLVVALAIVFLAYKVYFAQMKSGATAGNPISTIDEVGVKNDLLAIAQAERMYQAEHGGYASLDELTASGALAMRRSSRGGYTYGVETSSDNFRAVAHCPAATQPACTSWVVDRAMEVRPGE